MSQNLTVGTRLLQPRYVNLAQHADLPRVSIILRAESFDVINTPQWSNPHGNVNDGSFGRIQSVLSTKKELACQPDRCLAGHH